MDETLDALWKEHKLQLDERIEKLKSEPGRYHYAYTWTNNVQGAWMDISGRRVYYRIETRVVEGPNGPQIEAYYIAEPADTSHPSASSTATS